MRLSRYEKETVILLNAAEDTARSIAIEHLTQYRREIILLYFFLGFKNKEIAALHDCNAGKISYHKMRAVRQIRAEMEVRRHE